MWEDPVNELGGKWVIQFPRNKTGEDINTLWLYTVSSFYSFIIKYSKNWLDAQIYLYDILKLQNTAGKNLICLILLSLIWFRCLLALGKDLIMQTKYAVL